MNKRTATGMLIMMVGAYLLMSASSVAMAAEGASKAPETSLSSLWLDNRGAAALGGAIGAGLVVIGGARGISRIGGSAVESMARQPEVAGNISTAMIITSAMIEGATLFGVIVCLLAAIKEGADPL